jgi:hypothetical protein
MKKNKFLFLGMLALVLTFVLVLSGCPGPDTPTFTSKTNDATANDAATLGFVGTGVSSSDAAKATAEIVSGKIAITSVAAGTATITVSVPHLTSATIAVTVNATGDVAIGTIVKGATIENVELTTYALDATNSTANVTVQSISKVGETILVRVTGAIANGYDGKVNSAEISSGTWYGHAPNGSDSTLTHYALVTINSVIPAIVGSDDAGKKAHFATITNKALSAFYLEDWIQNGRLITDRANGIARWTHSSYGVSSTSETSDSLGTCELGTPTYTGRLWRNDSNQYIKVELDGADFAPGGNDARILVIDFSAVTWPAE